MNDGLRANVGPEAELEALRRRVRELEAQLPHERGSERRPPLQLLLENSPDSIAVMDLERRLLYLNRTVPSRTVEQVLGHDALEFVAPEQQASFAHAFERARALAQVQEFELTSQGSFIWETRLVPLVRDGKLFAIMGIAADVTQRRLAEHALRQAQKLEAVGRLTAGIAHNFNNMLMVILTNLRLCEGAADEAWKPRLADAEHAAQRAADVVRDLMVFTRKSSQKLELRTASLPEIAAGAIAICRSTFDSRIRFELEVEGAIAPVNVDANRVEQALINVLLNARDVLQTQLQTQSGASPEVKVILDMAHMPNGSMHGLAPAARLRVRDNGPGMSEAVRVRVFEPFFTTKQVDQGTGLGLAHVYGTMVEHRGAVECESQPGAGATFSLFFPV